MSRRVSEVVAVREADENHRVLEIHTTGGRPSFRVKPCEDEGPDKPACPWRRDARIGEYPAQAYRQSARTAYDMAEHVFGCHQHSAVDGPPMWCAGFLLRGAGDNMRVRMQARQLDFSVVHSDVELYDSYREMAEANGVAPDDPALAPCRGEAYEWRKDRE
ncbi:DUF6283 family protein [Streptomyces sp. NPDC046374]|uniref:DUF6283 family protein n=1 Tax=Streptomyces sp. NPDC046374 TaxID=3154917 RepID=UPI00340AFCBA